MSDLLQNVLILVAISSMPLGFVMALVFLMMIRENKKAIAANRVDINDCLTRLSVIESLAALKAEIRADVAEREAQ